MIQELTIEQPRGGTETRISEEANGRRFFFLGVRVNVKSVAGGCQSCISLAR